MADVCPTCGRPWPEVPLERESTVERLRTWLEAHGHRVDALDRVDERAASELLGVEPSTLRNRRYINGAEFLPFFKHGRSVSYALEDIAARILAGRVL